MTAENNRVPDVLRPTELHDFSDVFTAKKAHDGQAKTVLILAAVAALVFGALRVTDTTPIPSSPTALLTAR